MLPIITAKIEGPVLDEFMNTSVRKKLSAKWLQRLQKDALSGEYKNIDGQFHHSPDHSYYLAKCGGEPECLFAVTFRSIPASDKKDKSINQAGLSLARITNLPAHHGWQYLKAFTEDIMVPQGPFIIVSHFKGDGGIKAFQDLSAWLETHDKERAYKVKVICDKDKGCITNDNDAYKNFQ